MSLAMDESSEGHWTPSASASASSNNQSIALKGGRTFRMVLFPHLFIIIFFFCWFVGGRQMTGGFAATYLKLNDGWANCIDVLVTGAGSGRC